MDILVLTETGAYVADSDSSQASDMGSIPITRSITHDDSIGLAHLNCLNLAEKWPFLEPKWTPVESIGPWRFAEKTGQSGEPTTLTGPSFALSLALLAPKSGVRSLGSPSFSIFLLKTNELENIWWWHDVGKSGFACTESTEFSP
jgi:hypothetical protein